MAQPVAWTSKNSVVLQGTSDDILPAIAMARCRGFNVIYVTTSPANSASSTQHVRVVQSLEEAGKTLGGKAGKAHRDPSFPGETVHWWGIEEDMVISGMETVTLALSKLQPYDPDGNEVGAIEEDELEVWLQMESWLEGMNRTEMSEMLGSDRGMLKTLVNMGVQYCSQQKEAISRVIDRIQKNTKLYELLQKVENHLGKSKYLVADKPSGADVLLASVVHELILCICGANFPNIKRWLGELLQYPWFIEAFVATGYAIGGVQREGCQIDARAQPKKVAQLADESIRLNEGVKKTSAPRKTEKKEAKDKEDKPQPTSAKAPTKEQRPENSEEADLPAETRLQKAEAVLQKHNIAYELHRHKATQTVDALVQATSHIEGAIPVKNLFVKAKKAKHDGDSRMWLLIAKHDTPTNLKELGKQLGYKNIVLRFADDKTLASNLGTSQGNVSPLALFNDIAQLVNVAIDKRLLEHDGPVLVHPLTNEASVSVHVKDMVKCIEVSGHAWEEVEF